MLFRGYGHRPGRTDQRQLLIHRYKLVTLRARVKNELQHLALNQGMQKGWSLWSKDGQMQLLELPLAVLAGDTAEESAGVVAEMTSSRWSCLTRR